MKKFIKNILLCIVLAISFASIPLAANATSCFLVQQGGTGICSGLTGIIEGNGLSPFSPVTIGSGLSLTGGTLSATGITGVSSFNSRTGAVVPVSGDYTTSLVPEGSNLYFTAPRAISALTGQNVSLFNNDVGYLKTLSGDGTASGPGSTFTLSTVNSAPGTFGSSTNVPSFTVNGKGLVTSASSTSIAFPVTSVSNSDGSITVSPTTGNVVGSLNVGHANTWTGQQTFNTSPPIIGTGLATALTFLDGSKQVQTDSGLVWDNSLKELTIGGPNNWTGQPNTSLNVTSNVNAYSQINNQNKNSGNCASTDYINEADNDGVGLVGHYLDAGIDSSTYSCSNFPAAGANDSYLTSSGGGLLFSTDTAGKTLRFLTGGLTSANERMRVTDTGVGIGSTAPTAPLDIYNGILTSPTAGLLLEDTGTPATSVFYQSPALVMSASGKQLSGTSGTDIARTYLTSNDVNGGVLGNLLTQISTNNGSSYTTAYSYSPQNQTFAVRGDGGGALNAISLSAPTNSLSLSGSYSGSGAGSVNVTNGGSNTRTSGANVFFAVTPTYNQASGTAANTDLLVNRIETAIGSGLQKFIDLQKGGSSYWSVSNTGQQSWGTGLGAITHILGPSDQAFAIASQSPVAALASQNGQNLNLTASNATAGTTTASVATGGNVNITAGAGAAKTNSGGNGGGVTITGGIGSGSGSGLPGLVTIQGAPMNALSPTGGVTIQTQSNAGGGGGIGAINITGAGSNTATNGGSSVTGGVVNITTGAGGYNSNGGYSGTGGNLTITLGAGGANPNATTAVAGAGAAFSVVGGAGGNATAAGANTAGNGSSISLTSGTGGNASGGTSNTLGIGGTINIVAGNGGAGPGPAIVTGGSINITAGNAGAVTSNTAGGGSVTISGGVGSTSGAGTGSASGGVSLFGGNGNGSAAAGAILVQGGTAGAGTGGNTTISGGTGGGGSQGGNLILQAGISSVATSGSPGIPGANVTITSANGKPIAGGVGGNAGSITSTTGTGGAASNTTGLSGGSGGAYNLNTGAGGSTAGTSQTAGNAGSFVFTSGNGGAATGTTSTGGNSGSFNFTIGTPGTGTMANGANGDFNFTNGNIKIQTAGKGLYIKTGSNATMGTGTLVGGTATISTTAVASNSEIFVTDTGGGVLANIGSLIAPTSGITAATSFTVTSTNTLDTSTFNWIIINPA